MPDFIVNPDEIEPPEHLAPLPTRRGTKGSHGLHPEAEPPRTRGADPAPCTALCAWCGTRVLHGVTASGEHVVLDLRQRTWLVVHREGAGWPRLARSRGYVEHCCNTALR